MKRVPAVTAMALTVCMALTSCGSILDKINNTGIMLPTMAVAAASPSELMAGCDFIETEPEELIKLRPIERDYHADDSFTGGTITVNNSDFTIEQESIDKYFGSVMKDVEFEVSFYAVDLETGMSLGYNADRKLPPACTLKAGVALYCLREIVAGRGSMDDTVEYKRKHFVSGSGSIRKRGYGAILSVRELLTLMLDESDNIAYYMLIDYFGYDGYNSMMEELGCTHRIVEGNRWQAISAHELGLVWLEIYRFKDECEEGEFMWELLTTNMYNELDFTLNEYSANGYETIAHKSGWSENAFNDAGIVMAEHPYMIVVMTYVGLRTYAFLDTVIYLNKMFKTYWNWRDNGQPAAEIG